MRYAVGIDIGATKIASGLVDEEGELVSFVTSSTPGQSTESLLSAVKRASQNAAEGAGLDLASVHIIGVGIGAPGLVDHRIDVVRELPNLPDLANVPLRKMVEETLGLPVVLENDSNLAGLAEQKWGAARGHEHVVCMTVGTGVGGGIIVGGALLRGGIGTAGEVGHMVIDMEGPICTCGNHGCLESLASGTAIGLRAKAYLEEPAMRETAQSSQLWELCAGDPEQITPALVTAAAKEGDELALRVYNECGEALGVGIANLINIFNPEVVVVGGGVIEAAGELMLGPARAEASARALAPSFEAATIVPAAFGNKAGVLGAAAAVYTRMG